MFANDACLSRRVLYRLGSTLLVLILFSTPAAAWGEEGHHVVAMIAARHLTPAAETEINTILMNGLCSSQPTVTDKLVCVSLWADGSRFSTHKHTYNWHFVDISLNHQTYDAARDCPPKPGEEAKGFCGLAGLDHSLKILRKEITDPKITRAQALMFVVHIVGDLHQPLHTVHEGLGGNFHTVKYFGFWSQMHKVWDGKIIGTRLIKLGQDEEEYADTLNLELTSVLGSYQQGDPISWLNATHSKAIDDAYGWKFKDGKAQGSGGRKYPWLRNNYYEHNVDIVEDQLKRGGARLARILNDAIG